LTFFKEIKLTKKDAFCFLYGNIAIRFPLYQEKTECFFIKRNIIACQGRRAALRIHEELQSQTLTLTLIFYLPSTYTCCTIPCPRYYLGLEKQVGNRCSRVSHTHLALPKIVKIDTPNHFILFKFYF
jgi:hypothetical protein